MENQTTTVGIHLVVNVIEKQKKKVGMPLVVTFVENKKNNSGDAYGCRSCEKSKKKT